MNENINKIVARGIIVKETFNKNNIEYDVEIDYTDNLLEGIKSLIDNEREFFLLSRQTELNFIDATYNIVCKYRELPNKNNSLINYIIRELNMLSVEKYNVENLEKYLTNDCLDHGMVSDNLEDIAYGMLYDTAVYNALTNSKFDIDDFNGIVNSICYFFNRTPEIYKDSKIYNNTIILLDNTIHKSLPLTNRRTVAKYIKERLEMTRIHE